MVRSDRKAIVAGIDLSDSVGMNNFVLVRLNIDGTADKSFGTLGDGVVVLKSKNVLASYIALQSDNKIIVVDVASTSDKQFMVVRYNSNGTLDTSFGNAGIAMVPLSGTTNDVAHDVAIQKDGKIVIAGSARSGSINNNDDGAVVRLNTDGSLDTSFGDHGKTLIGLGDDEVAEGMTIDYVGSASSNTDYGKIVVVGKSVGDTTQFMFARLNTNGKLDTSFHKNGKFVAPFVSEDKFADAASVAIESNNKIVVAGTVGKTATSSHSIGVIRLNRDGTGDSTFGPSNGQIQINFEGSTTARTIVVNQTGELLVAGAGFSLSSVALLTSDGTLDKVFGSTGDGKVDSGPLNGLSSYGGLALSPGGLYVIAFGNQFAVWRFFDRSPVTASIAVLQANAFEQGKVPADFNVVLSKNVSQTTPVFIIPSGTATSPFALLRSQVDYSGLTAAPPPVVGTTSGGGGFPRFGQAAVNIDAGTGFKPVFITPNDDARVENDETVILTLAISPDYDINPAFASATAIIHDNDSPTSTAKTLTATADAYVQDGSAAGTNFGSSTQLEVKEGSSGVNRQAYLKFDLSSVSTVNSVKLNLFGKLSNVDATNIVTQLFSVADTSWSETAINFNNKPAAGSTALGTATIANTTQTMYTFDVTAYVKAQLAAGHKTVSFALKNPSGGSPYVIFNLREASSGQPQLAIT